MEKFAKKKCIHNINAQKSKEQRQAIINDIKSGKGLKPLEENKCTECILVPSKPNVIKDIKLGKGLKPINER